MTTDINKSSDDNKMTLSWSVIANGRRDIIAHGASEPFLESVFNHLKKHSLTAGLDIEITDQRAD